MRKSIQLFIATLILLGFSSCAYQKHSVNNGVVRYVAMKKTNYVVPLTNILTQVKDQYDLAKKMLVDSGSTQNIELQEADVIFDATNNIIFDGNIAVFVAKADFKTTLNDESTVTFTLSKTPPPAIHAMKAKHDNSLAELIYNAGKAFNNSSRFVIDNAKMQTFETDIIYSITYDGTLTVGTTQPANIGGGGSVEINHQAKHTIKLIFTRKTT